MSDTDDSVPMLPSDDEEEIPEIPSDSDSDLPPPPSDDDSLPSEPESDDENEVQGLSKLRKDEGELALIDDDVAEIARKEEEEFENQFAAQLAQLELLKKQQEIQEQQLQDLRLEQEVQARLAEAKRLQQIKELELFKKDQESLSLEEKEMLALLQKQRGDSAPLSPQSPSIPKKKDGIHYEVSDLTGMTRMIPTSAERLLETFHRLYQTIEELEEALSNFDHSKGVVLRDMRINGMMKKVLTLHPKLISLLVSGALTEDELYEEAKKLNARFQNVVEMYKGVEKGAAVALPPKRSTEMYGSRPTEHTPTASTTPSAVAKGSSTPVAESAAGATPAAGQNETAPRDSNHTPAASPPPLRPAHEHHITVEPVKMLISYPQQYVNPTLTMLVVCDGRIIEAARNIPVEMTPDPEANLLRFKGSLETSYTVSQLKAQGANTAVVLEFKHFKPRKNKISTRVWAFFYAEEARSGEFQVNLYKKPSDYKLIKHNPFKENNQNNYLQLRIKIQ